MRVTKSQLILVTGIKFRSDSIFYNHSFKTIIHTNILLNSYNTFTLSVFSTSFVFVQDRSLVLLKYCISVYICSHENVYEYNVYVYMCIYIFVCIYRLYLSLLTYLFTKLILLLPYLVFCLRNCMWWLYHASK